MTFKVLVDSSPNYRERTKQNADSADLTIAIAANFFTAGEKLTRQVAGDKYIALDIRDKSIDNARKLYKTCKAIGAKKLNIAGNGIYTLNEYLGLVQEEVDEYVFEVLKPIHEHLGVDFVRSGGQSGVDQAGVVSGIALGIPSMILMPSRCKRRDVNNKDFYSDERLVFEEYHTSANRLKNKFLK